MEKIAFLDLDKTLYDGFLFFEWGNYLRVKKVFSKSKTLRLDATSFFFTLLRDLKIISYLRASQYVSNEIGKILKGHDISKVLNPTYDFIDSVKGNFYDYAKPLVARLKNDGFKVVFVTNEPDFMAEVIKNYLAGDDALGLDIKVKDGVFTGKIVNDLSTRFGKAKTVKEYAERNDVYLQECIALGDSEGDIEMLKEVGRGLLLVDGGTSNSVKTLSMQENIQTSERNLEEIVNKLGIN